MGTLSTLKDLARKAGRWLGLTPPAAHTAAIAGDRFDQMSWREIYDQAPALRELDEELGERHHHTTDLLRDVWTAAYKSDPQLRERDQMDPSRLVNHRVVATMLQVPEFDELRRETVGDPYPAAMAVLAQAPALRRLLEQTEQAQQAADAAAQARQQAAQAAAAVQDALEQAAAQADDDGDVPDPAADQLAQTIAAAQAADADADQADAQAQAALEHAAPGISSAVRAAANTAAEQARQESALMTAWGVEPGQLQRMSFPQRRQLAERLRNGRLGDFAQLIGRFRIMAQGERARRTEHAVGELVGITLGDDLSRLIPSELASLGVPAMRAAFVARLAEQRLMVYETRGENRVGQGAIIACIDCSSSMAAPVGEDGTTREAWAKACALALLDQARAAQRDFVAILFSSAEELAVFRFPAGRSAAIADVVEFTEHFFGGGTSFSSPLQAAAQVLEAEYNADGTARGDIVLITDGECGVSEDWMRAWTQAKHTLDFRVFGVAIARSPSPVLEALSDNLRTITDLVDVGAARDMFRVI
ncbi:VWA domain-containing protein [Nonomuraea typhae]|uniref:VWA domain-containing protein n=1 Tax=Nonomuraea typhae TaxID=2603600 RepID=UPI0012F950F8|nr:VWA domain-containing protein [Nonomuraea typhae]